MDTNFWHDKWAKNEIAFHGREAHPLLVKHVSALALPPGARVFLPLCGKTLDIHWLLAQGMRVAGVELSSLAIDQLFAELGVQPQVSRVGDLTRYSADHIDIFVGDFFQVSSAQLGVVNAVYDRAALVALPPEMRVRYAAQLMAVTACAPQLLICFDYDQALQAGPPFAVPGAEVRAHYGQACDVALLESMSLAGGLKGRSAAQEEVWLVTPGAGDGRNAATASSW
jgi:thiopurine S-methyltransferase